MTFVFNLAAEEIRTGSLDLASGTYYAHLVESAPANSATAVSNLTVSTATGYIPQSLTGKSLTGGVWTFGQVDFPTYNFPNPLVGVVICKQAAASPSPSDRVVSFSLFKNAAGANVVVPVSTTKIPHTFGTDGAIKLQNVYAYTSGSYSGVFPDTNGLLYLLGTSNNTQTYANPITSKINAMGGGTPSNSTDRDSATIVSNALSLALDFSGASGTKGRKIRVSSLRLVAAVNAYGNSGTVTLSGSNSLPAFTTAYINDDNYWTALASGNIDFNLSASNLNSSDTATYWRYIRVSGSKALDFREIEFYNSTISSPDLNMTA